MSYALVAHDKVGSPDTSSGVNTSGADLLAAFVTYWHNAAAPSFSDSYGNTWVPILTEVNANGERGSLYYVANPTVGSSHTISVSNAGNSGGATFAAFSGAHATPLDQASSDGGTQPGSVTPSENNELLVSAFGAGDGAAPGPFTPDGGFTVTDYIDYVFFGTEPNALAYLIQTTAAAANPSWSPGSGPVFIASFAPAIPLPAPTVSSVSPNSGTTLGTTPVTITGTDFTPTILDVTFGGASATSIVRTASTTIDCVTPAHAAGAVNVTVTNSDSQTGTLVNGYTYTAPAGGGSTSLRMSMGIGLRLS